MTPNATPPVASRIALRAGLAHSGSRPAPCSHATSDVVNIRFAILFVIVAYGFSLALTAFTLALEQWTYRGYGRLSDRLYLLGISLFEGLGYRQLTAVWRFRGLAKYTRGSREWGVMTREGFGPPVSSEPMTNDERADAPAR